jgi:glyoxylase-like metal-dependent hydrolase (beta-lactamase superfamily II)
MATSGPRAPSSLPMRRLWPDMRSRGGDQLAALRSLLGAAADDTVPTLPTRLLEGPDARLTLGGTVFELRHRGGGHTPGDMMVWLPQAQVAFAGDIVYVDRLLAVLPVSSTQGMAGRIRGAGATRAEAHRAGPWPRDRPGHGACTDPGLSRGPARSHETRRRAGHRRERRGEVVQCGAVPAPVERLGAESRECQPDLSSKSSASDLGCLMAIHRRFTGS